MLNSPMITDAASSILKWATLLLYMGYKKLQYSEVLVQLHAFSILEKDLTGQFG